VKPFLLIVAAIVTAFAAAYLLVGLAFAVLVLAGCLLFGAVALTWQSLQQLSGDTPLTLEQALEMGAPVAEEEQKRAALRALKDLDYELSVGKITPEDHAKLSSEARERARELLRVVDDRLAPSVAAAEAYLAEHLPPELRGPAPADASTPTSAKPLASPSRRKRRKGKGTAQEPASSTPRQTDADTEEKSRS